MQPLQPINGAPAPAASQPARAVAVVVQAADDDRFALLAAALAQSGFWAHLDATRRRLTIEPAQVQIIIKPDFTLFDHGASTGADPALVEHLIDLLHERGYCQVAVGGSRDSFDLWLENRDIMFLAELVGYRFVTERGHAYDVIDLGEDIVDVAFPAGSALYGTGLARAWVAAHYRIGVAKNKTDEEYFYALGLQNLLDILPLRDKEYHYRHRLKPWDVAVDLLAAAPVQFSIIDAFVSNHGGAGTRESHPIATGTLIASPHLLLADWAATIKMGLDPYASPLNARALQMIGLPADYTIDGDMAAYPDWINVHPLLDDSVRRRHQSVALSRMNKPWLQAVNHELFPFKDVINERLNALAARYLANPDQNPAAFWGLIGLNYLLGLAYEALQAYQTMYDKDRLRWRDVPLDLDLAAYPPADYQALVDYLAPLAQLIGATPADSNGLRWRYLDGSVLFEFSRVIPVPYTDFVARVQIGKAIQLMNDYIGGVAVAVAHDDQGRVTRQAERNLYLPQPNYVVLYQGKIIDVTKLEYIQYGEQEQTIFWRTIASANGSAEFDDGIVTFARTANDETLVRVVGRQQFTLPPFLQALNLELHPQLKDHLVAHAYTTFFIQTIANFEATYEQREIRIGRPWQPAEGQPGVAGETLPAEQIIALLTKAGELLNQYLGSAAGGLLGQRPPSRPQPSYVDEDGFAHFQSTAVNDADPQSTPFASDWGNLRDLLLKTGAEARQYLTDIAGAVEKDWGIRPEEGA
jgi:uncharacterized protein (DUF362 family)